MKRREIKVRGVRATSGVSERRGTTRETTERKYVIERGEEGPICGASLAVLDKMLNFQGR